MRHQAASPEVESSSITSPQPTLPHHHDTPATHCYLCPAPATAPAPGPAEEGDDEERGDRIQ